MKKGAKKGKIAALEEANFRLRRELESAIAQRNDHQEQRTAMAGAYDLMGTRLSLAKEGGRNCQKVVDALRRAVAEAAELFEGRVVKYRDPEGIDAWLARPEVVEARKT